MFLQSLLSRSAFVMLLLVIDVFDYPFQIFRPERHYPVSALPFQRLGLDLVIDVIRTCSFQLANPIRYQNIRLQAGADVNVRFDAVERVENSAFCFEYFMRQIMVQPFLDLCVYHRQTIFSVPNDVEIDLGINAVRHFAKAGKGR